MAFPRRPSAALRYVIPAFLFAFCFWLLASPSDLTSGVSSIASPWRSKQSPGKHPIDRLIEAAEKDFAEKLSKTSRTLSEAAARYRERRGRHPPPGFDRWYQFAREKDALIVEDFWDQIYHDIEPFWALKPARIRKDAWDFEMRISIRDGKASSGSDWFWTTIWLDLIGTIEHMLPDMDLALNAMDEPRLVVPWEDINGYMKKAAKTRRMADAKSVVSEFEKLAAPGQGPDQHEKTPEKQWEGEKHYWLIARRGCAPSSPARKAAVITDFDTTPLIKSSFALKHMRDGFVANYTLSTDFCHQPDQQGLEGIFVEPLSVSATKVLFPMFGGSKLAVNNEILLPAPMYWKEEERFMGSEGADIPWSDKEDMAIWRGVATGGHNREHTWRAFQRHRFVAMNNATQLALAENGTSAPPNFGLPPKEYRLAARRHSRLADWVGSWSSVALTDLMCDYEDHEPNQCNYTSPYFSVVPGMPMAEQFHYKYLPDIDGNSFSGRYLGFLRSTSLPVKATLWREWHDSRLIAWKHFVPMDTRFGDWYGIMEYFLGDQMSGIPAHDEAAERIALAGKEWAARVLRKEDMQVYVLRLLLEYARVSDDRRESMGWVGDLLKGET